MTNVILVVKFSLLAGMLMLCNMCEDLIDDAYTVTVINNSDKAIAVWGGYLTEEEIAQDPYLKVMTVHKDYNYIVKLAEVPAKASQMFESHINHDSKNDLLDILIFDKEAYDEYIKQGRQNPDCQLKEIAPILQRFILSVEDIKRLKSQVVFDGI